MKKILVIVSFLIITFVVYFPAVYHNQNAVQDTVGAINTNKEEKHEYDNDVIFSVNSAAALKQMYKTIEEFNNSNTVDTIVKGKISDIQYVYLDQIAFSVLTIEVQKSYKGNPAKTIKVYEEGGYIKLKDMLDDLKPHYDVKSFSTDQIENSVVDVKFFNAPHSTKDQQVIMYLIKNTDLRGPETYRIESSTYGKFTLDNQDGKYKRLALDPKEYPAHKIAAFETSIDGSNVDNKLNSKK